MKKKKGWILLVVLAILLAGIAGGIVWFVTQNGQNDEPDDQYSFQNPTEPEQNEGGFSVDGVLDEPAYSQNRWLKTLTTSGDDLAWVDMTTVYTETGIYIGIDVKETTNIYVNPSRATYLNSCIELYMAEDTVTTMQDKNAFEIDLLPDGSFSFKRWGGTSWVVTGCPGAQFAAKTDGTLNTADCHGYSLELYLPYELLKYWGFNEENLENRELLLNPAHITSYNHTGTNKDVDRWWYLIGSQLVGGNHMEPQTWYRFDSNGLRAYDLIVNANDNTLGTVTGLGGYNFAPIGTQAKLEIHEAQNGMLSSLVVDGKEMIDRVHYDEAGYAEYLILEKPTANITIDAVFEGFEAGHIVQASAAVSGSKIGKPVSLAGKTAVLTNRNTKKEYTLEIGEDGKISGELETGIYKMAVDNYVAVVMVTENGFHKDAYALVWKVFSDLTNGANDSRANEGLLILPNGGRQWATFADTFGDFDFTMYVKDHPDADTPNPRTELRLVFENEQVVSFGIIQYDDRVALQSLGDAGMLFPWNEHAHLSSTEKEQYHTATGVRYGIKREGTTIKLYINENRVKTLDLSKYISADTKVKLTIHHFDDTGVELDIPFTFDGDFGTVRVETAECTNGRIWSEKDTYDRFGTATVNIEPDEGYILDTILVNGKDMTAKVYGNVLEIGGIREDSLIEATFKPVERIEATLHITGYKLQSTYDLSNTEIKAVSNLDVVTAKTDSAGKVSLKLVEGFQYEISAEYYISDTIVAGEDTEVTLEYDMFKESAVWDISKQNEGIITLPKGGSGVLELTKSVNNFSFQINAKDDPAVSGTAPRTEIYLEFSNGKKVSFGVTTHTTNGQDFVQSLGSEGMLIPWANHGYLTEEESASYRSSNGVPFQVVRYGTKVGLYIGDRPLASVDLSEYITENTSAKLSVRHWDDAGIVLNFRYNYYDLYRTSTTVTASGYKWGKDTSLAGLTLVAENEVETVTAQLDENATATLKLLGGMNYRVSVEGYADEVITAGKKNTVKLQYRIFEDTAGWDITKQNDGSVTMLGGGNKRIYFANPYVNFGVTMLVQDHPEGTADYDPRTEIYIQFENEQHVSFGVVSYDGVGYIQSRGGVEGILFPFQNHVQLTEQEYDTYINGGIYFSVVRKGTTVDTYIGTRLAKSFDLSEYIAADTAARYCINHYDDVGPDIAVPFYYTDSFGAVQVDIQDAAHGTISTDKEAYSAYEFITLMIQPETDHVLTSLVVNGAEMLGLVENGTLTIPATDVVVIPKFESINRVATELTVSGYNLKKNISFAGQTIFAKNRFETIQQTVSENGTVTFELAADETYNVYVEGYDPQTVTAGNAGSLVLQYRVFKDSDVWDISQQNECLITLPSGGAGNLYFANTATDFGFTMQVKDHPDATGTAPRTELLLKFDNGKMVSFGVTTHGTNGQDFIQSMGGSAYLLPWGNHGYMTAEESAQYRSVEGIRFSVVRRGTNFHLYLGNRLAKTVELSGEINADTVVELEIRHWDDTGVELKYPFFYTDSFRQVEISLQQGEHGTITTDKTEYRAYDDATFTFTPEEDYALQTVLLNGQDVTDRVSSGTLTLVGLSGDVTVSATYSPIQRIATTVAITGRKLQEDISFAGVTVTASNSVDTVQSVVAEDGTVVFRLMEGEIYNITVDGYIPQSVTAGVDATIVLQYKMFTENSAWDLSKQNEGAISLPSGGTGDLWFANQYTDFKFTINVKDHPGANTPVPRNQLLLMFTNGTMVTFDVTTHTNGQDHVQSFGGTGYLIGWTNHGFLTAAESALYRSEVGVDFTVLRQGTKFSLYIGSRLVNEVDLSAYIAADTKATLRLRHWDDAGVNLKFPFTFESLERVSTVVQISGYKLQENVDLTGAEITAVSQGDTVTATVAEDGTVTMSLLQGKTYELSADRYIPQNVTAGVDAAIILQYRMFTDNAVWDLSKQNDGAISLPSGGTGDLWFAQQYTDFKFTVRVKDHPGATTPVPRNQLLLVFANGKMVTFDVTTHTNGQDHVQSFGGSAYLIGWTNHGYLTTAESTLYRSEVGVDFTVLRQGTKFSLYIGSRLVNEVDLSAYIAADTAATLRFRHWDDAGVNLEFPFVFESPERVSTVLQISGYKLQENVDLTGAEITAVSQDDTVTATVQSDGTVTMDLLYGETYELSVDRYIPQTVVAGKNAAIVFQYKVFTDNAGWDLSKQNDGQISLLSGGKSNLNFENSYGDFKFTMNVMDHPGAATPVPRTELLLKFDNGNMVTFGVTTHATNGQDFIQSMGGGTYLLGWGNHGYLNAEESALYRSAEGVAFTVERIGTTIKLYIGDRLMKTVDLSAYISDSNLADLEIRHFDDAGVQLDYSFTLQSSQRMQASIAVSGYKMKEKVSLVGKELTASCLTETLTATVDANGKVNLNLLADTQYEISLEGYSPEKITASATEVKLQYLIFQSNTAWDLSEQNDGQISLLNGGSGNLYFTDTYTDFTFTINPKDHPGATGAAPRTELLLKFDNGKMVSFGVTTHASNGQDFIQSLQNGAGTMLLGWYNHGYLNATESALYRSAEGVPFTVQRQGTTIRLYIGERLMNTVDMSAYIAEDTTVSLEIRHWDDAGIKLDYSFSIE